MLLLKIKTVRYTSAIKVNIFYRLKPVNTNLQKTSQNRLACFLVIYFYFCSTFLENPQSIRNRMEMQQDNEYMFCQFFTPTYLRCSEYKIIPYCMHCILDFDDFILPFCQIDKLNDMIKHLKTSIHNVEKNAEDQSHRIIADAAKAESAELKNSDGKKAKLQQEIIQLKQSLQSNLTTHRESELALRKVRFYQCYLLPNSKKSHDIISAIS